MNEPWKIATFAAYSVCYEAIIWGVSGYAVFWKDHSGWWILAAMVMSGSQLKPRHFGINESAPLEDKE